MTFGTYLGGALRWDHKCFSEPVMSRSQPLLSYQVDPPAAAQWPIPLLKVVFAFSA